MMKKLSLFLTGALVMSSAVAIAQTDTATERPIPAFNVLDVNKDGVISESEALYFNLSDKLFKVWDTNGDDMLTEAEYDKGLAEKSDVDTGTEGY
ncbi:MAG: hypothetical protein WA987_03595 [Cellvibrio sp.]